MNRRAREKAGRRAESLACWYLRLKGYRVLGRRIKNKSGEIDILARRGGTLVVVEVKNRSDEIAARDSLGTRDWQRLAAAARVQIARTPALGGLALRFDAIFVIGRWKIIHHVDFWRPH